MYDFWDQVIKSTMAFSFISFLNGPLRESKCHVIRIFNQAYGESHRVKNWASCQEPAKKWSLLQQPPEWASLEVDDFALIKPADDCSSADILTKISERPVTMNQLAKALTSFLTT